MVRNFLLIALLLLSSTPTAPAGSVTFDEWLLTSGVTALGSTDDDLTFFDQVDFPFYEVHEASAGFSTARSTYDFTASEVIRIRASTELTAATINDVTVFSANDGRITITVTEPISILVDAELNFDLPMDQMRADMSVGFISLDGAPIGGGQSFNYNTIFGTGPNSFVYEDQFDIPPGQYLLAYSMDIDATPSSAGAVGTANGFVEFRIVPEPAIAVPVLLFTFLTKRPARVRSLTNSCQATAKKCSKR